jgi:hypothetical protein
MLARFGPSPAEEALWELGAKAKLCGFAGEFSAQSWCSFRNNDRAAETAAPRMQAIIFKPSAL